MSTTISSSSNQSYNVALPILPLTTPSRKWHALTTRTSCPTLPFYYGVLATKIYCRPTCTARLARRANVVCFTSAQAAQSAGYRACKRCRPDDELFFGEAEEVVMRAMTVIERLGGKWVAEDSSRDGGDEELSVQGIQEDYGHDGGSVYQRV